MRLSDVELGFRLQPVDLTQQRAFPEFDPRLGEVRFRLLQLGSALLAIGAVLCFALLHLVLQVLVFRIRIARLVEEFRAIEFRDHVARPHHGAARKYLGENQAAAARIHNLRNHHSDRLDRLYRASGANVSGDLAAGDRRDLSG